MAPLRRVGLDALWEGMSVAQLSLRTCLKARQCCGRSRNKKVVWRLISWWGFPLLVKVETKPVRSFLEGQGLLKVRGSCVPATTADAYEPLLMWAQLHLPTSLHNPALPLEVMDF